MPKWKPIKVVDIELSSPIVTLDGLEGYEAIQGLVRLHGAPLGYIKVPILQGRCTAATLSAAILEQHSLAIIRHLVSDGLAELPGAALQIHDLVDLPHPAYAGPLPLVTVAVCTRDRAADLARCLEALTQLRYPRLDILVVDNAPATDATAQLVRKYASLVRYVCEPRPGLNWARNRAIQEAHGDIIAFTDDDVVVDPGWALALAALFAEHPHLMAVTGLVVPYELETETQALFEQYGGFGRGFERKWYCVEDGERTAKRYAWPGMFGTGANMAYRRSVFEHVGLFDPALDVGTVSNGGGDIEMFFRILKGGHTLVYEPSAMVRHRHRRDHKGLHRQITDNGIGFSAYLVRTALAYPDERFAIARFWQWWLRTWHISRLVNSLRKREPFPRPLIIAEAWGFLVGLNRYQQARSAAAAIARRFDTQEYTA